ncbi:unnamed protein product [Vitrella brassicaformis CCMP3155]|uniref:rRNA-processing protein EFG1 n=3 Tax=Vitrella brassicaformis TaxID=1169539 RepID=A0A0G4EL93_VITBC|nr:unnamed protein product [Vitrella brassicaformis CCMP3155]|eukprot:CEL97277.1 unnamed protein product [Vitrella brassicaformis CCMP3155]
MKKSHADTRKPSTVAHRGLSIMKSGPRDDADSSHIDRSRKSPEERIQDIQRVLERTKDLPAEQRERLEGRIQSLKKQAKRSKFFESRQKFYKRIRFVEEVKVQRQLKKCRKQLAELLQRGDQAEDHDGEDLPAQIDALRQQLAKHEDDLQYIKHYPLDKPYIALFAPMEGPTEEIVKKRAEIRQQIRSRLVKRRAKLDQPDQQDDLDDDDFFAVPGAEKAADDGRPDRGDTMRGYRGHVRGRGAARGRGIARESVPGKGRHDSGVNVRGGGRQRGERGRGRGRGVERKDGHGGGGQGQAAMKDEATSQPQRSHVFFDDDD